MRFTIEVFLLVFLGACGDAGLVEPIETPPDPIEVDPEYVAWLRENGHLITSYTSAETNDLQFLKPLLDGRRFVQLGESSHGVREFNLAKVRLIKFLHEEMGFDVIAFESSVYECYATNKDPSLNTPHSMMRNCIYQVWHTEEVLPLFEYIRATQSTDRPLVLAGFDVQRSSLHGVASRPQFLGDVVARIDEEYASVVEAFDQTFVSAMQDHEYNNLIDQNGEQMVQEYEALVEFLDLNEQTLLAVYPDDPAIPLVARQTAWSILQYVLEVQALEADRCIGFAVRDSGMAENVGFLLNRLYPDKKIIGWAHNGHIRHNGMDLRDESRASCPNMGMWVAQRHRSELYTVGLFMHHGLAMANNRKPYGIPHAPVHSMEWILHAATLPVVWVDMLHQERSAGNTWMFEETITRGWGVNIQHSVPRDQYDAILFIDEVRAPEYIYLWPN